MSTTDEEAVEGDNVNYSDRVRGMRIAAVKALGEQQAKELADARAQNEALKAQIGGRPAKVGSALGKDGESDALEEEEEEEDEEHEDAAPQPKKTAMSAASRAKSAKRKVGVSMELGGGVTAAEMASMLKTLRDSAHGSGADVMSLPDVLRYVFPSFFS